MIMKIKENKGFLGKKNFQVTIPCYFCFHWKNNSTFFLEVICKCGSVLCVQARSRWLRVRNDSNILSLKWYVNVEVHCACRPVLGWPSVRRSWRTFCMRWNWEWRRRKKGWWPLLRRRRRCSRLCKTWRNSMFTFANRLFMCAVYCVVQMCVPPWPKVFAEVFVCFICVERKFCVYA
jgi:hypothetical protein